MDHWIVYDVASGEVLYRGSSPTGTASYQQLPEGADIIVVPVAVIARPALDLDALRNDLVLRIDLAAEAARMAHLTPGQGQAAVYQRKEAEARAIIAGSSDRTPILDAEANAISVSVAELARDVIARADAWSSTAAAIEAARMTAKLRLRAAITFAALIEAADLDINLQGA